MFKTIIEKVFVFIKGLISKQTTSSQQDIEQLNLLKHLIEELLLFLEDYKISDAEKEHLLKEAEAILSNCKKTSDLSRLAGQLLMTIKKGNITKEDCIRLKCQVYCCLLDNDIDKNGNGKH